MDNAIALQIATPQQIDLGGSLMKAAQIHGLMNRTQLDQLKLREGTERFGSLQGFKQAMESGDPNAIRFLLSQPDLYHQAIQNQQSTDVLNRERNARGAQRVRSLSGDAKTQAWNEELDHGLREGRIPSLLHQQLKAKGPDDQMLDNIIAQGQPLTPPHFGVVGQDLGEPQYGWQDTLRRTITGPTGLPISQPGQTGPAERRGGLTGQPFLDAIAERHGKGTADQVKGIAEGRYPYPSPNSRDPRAKQLALMVLQYDPSFDSVDTAARAKTRLAFTSGPEARNIASLNTVMGHFDDLEKAITALNNSNLPMSSFFRFFTNPIATTFSAGAESHMRTFEQKRNAVADEMARVFKGAGISDTEIQEWKKTYSATDRESTLRDSVKAGISLMDSRLQALGNAYERGMGKAKDPLELLSPKAQAAYLRLTGREPEKVSAGPGGQPGLRSPVTNREIPLPAINILNEIKAGAQRIVLPDGTALSAQQYVDFFQQKYGLNAQQFLPPRSSSAPRAGIPALPGAPY